MNEPVEFWRETVRLGVEALDFSLLRLGGEVMMRAESAGGPLNPAVLMASHAAIEVDKYVGMEGTKTLAGNAREGLAAQLERGPAAGELEIYQRHLVDRVWLDVKDDPARILEEMATPHADD